MSEPLSDAERTDARRFLGFGMYGAVGEGDPTYGRYNYQNMTLEYRLSNMSDAELAVARSYLVTLNTLEAAIPKSADNLVAASAASYQHNPNELRDRKRLLDMWARRFGTFLGIPIEDGAGSSSSTVRLIV